MSRRMRMPLKLMLGWSAALLITGAIAQEAAVLKPPFEAKELKPRRPFTQQLPDLLPREVEVDVFSGTAVTVKVDVKNQGTAASTPTKVAATARVIDTTNNTRVSTQEFSADVPALTAGANKWVVLGSVQLPDRTKDWLITFVPTVADPSPPGARGGIVAESNEDNNEIRYRCIVYGPNGDPSKLTHLNAPSCD